MVGLGEGAASRRSNGLRSPQCKKFCNFSVVLCSFRTIFQAIKPAQKEHSKVQLTLLPAFADVLDLTFADICICIIESIVKDDGTSTEGDVGGSCGPLPFKLIFSPLSPTVACVSNGLECKECSPVGVDTSDLCVGDDKMLVEGRLIMDDS